MRKVFRQIIARLFRPASPCAMFCAWKRRSKVERDALDLRPPGVDDGGAFHRLTVYGEKPRDLDAIIPLLRNLGLRVVDQIQFVLTIEQRQLYIRKFFVKAINAAAAGLSNYKRPLLEALDALLSDQTDDDALNGLVMPTGFDWRTVELLRAYCNYYLQINSRFEPRRVQGALIANYEAASLLYRYSKPDSSRMRSRQRGDGKPRA